MPLSKDQVREKLLSYKSQHARRDKIDLDWLPELGVTKDADGNVLEDNRLEVREAMSDESLAFAKEQETDKNRAIGRLVARCLLMPGTNTPVFNENDITAIMRELGFGVINSVINKIQELSGVTPTAQVDAEKNSEMTPPNGSSGN